MQDTLYWCLHEAHKHVPAKISEENSQASIGCQKNRKIAIFFTNFKAVNMTKTRPIVDIDSNFV